MCAHHCRLVGFGREEDLSSPELSDVIAEVAAEVEEDFVGLWVVARLVREDRPDADSVELRGVTADVCGALLAQGASLGQFRPDGEFETWDPASAVDRLLVEWNDLGRDPDIGEITWLR